LNPQRNSPSLQGRRMVIPGRVREHQPTPQTITQRYKKDSCWTKERRGFPCSFSKVWHIVRPLDEVEVAVKQGFWSADWFVGLVVCLVFAVAAWTDSPFLTGMERTAYDIGVRGASNTPSPRIAVIAIDDESLENIGRWPWPRDVIGDMVGKLTAGGAKVVGLPIAFSEPQTSPGLVYIDQIEQLNRDQGAPLRDLMPIVDEARNKLDTDGRLAGQIATAGNVILGMDFLLAEPVGNPDAPLPPYIARHLIDANSKQVNASQEAFELGLLPWAASRVETPPIPRVGEAASSIGHMNLSWDVDGGNRRDALVVSYYDYYAPSFALQVAASSLNLGPKDISLTLGESLQLGRLTIRTDPYLEMLTFYYSDVNGKPAFSVDSFFDVREGKVPAAKYKDKIVLIGPTAKGVGTPQKTPVDAAMMPVVALAHTISSILQEHFFVVPAWANLAELGVFVLIALYLIALLPRLKAGPAAGLTALALVILLGAQYVLLTTQATWLQLVTPAILLVLGHIILTTKRFLVTERGKEKSEAESAETNRMLGLAYQGKGDLDMSFASFRKVRPVDDSVLDLLYNLALDFERKRQFNKAVSVYQYINEHSPSFRDVETRMNRSRNLEETVLLGAGGGGPAATLIMEGGGVQKPMLGRYQVEKELGKGAMGVVYLGLDPKINRTVAIKTMALSQEFEGDELDEVKERFFREAETAGRLNHPNIVTIFDAGEEHDLAYIAMEFIKGGDLSPYTKADRLLSVKKVLDIVEKSALALDYAHSENVVHRDIKPANIMYESETEGVKLTDFGIARITDSSKTKTGMVLGTPSYMSPEQLQGKRVDGRSDLFSLGVMMFQLLTGKLPFTGDSMTTLMWNISREEHPDILQVRPDLPPGLKAIIDKALHKSANERYSRGAQMVEDLRACASGPAA
jgi:CHASE2 domain-containing sensor protein/tRNA A-37 threonylcarbamoyl transferase component Bud32